MGCRRLSAPRPRRAGPRLGAGRRALLGPCPGGSRPPVVAPCRRHPLRRPGSGRLPRNAEVYGILMAPHNPYGPVALAAAAQVAAAIQNFLIPEHCPLQPWFDRLQREPLPVTRGPSYRSGRAGAAAGTGSGAGRGGARRTRRPHAAGPAALRDPRRRHAAALKLKPWTGRRQCPASTARRSSMFAGWTIPSRLPSARAGSCIPPVPAARCTGSTWPPTAPSSSPPPPTAVWARRWMPPATCTVPRPASAPW